jgi:hypothetical protein
MDDPSKVVEIRLESDNPAPSPPAEPPKPAAGGTGGTGLTPQQWKAITLLAAGKNITAVATEIGIDPSTLHRWKRNSTFSVELRCAVEDFCEEIRGQSRGLAARAVETLEDVMWVYPKQGAAVAAAVAVLRMHGLDRPKETKE